MKTGYNGRKRFSLFYPWGIERWGCCDPKIDSGRTIVKRGDDFLLVQEQHGEGFPPAVDVALPPETKACNGYYDHEHDGWLPVREYYERFMK